MKYFVPFLCCVCGILVGCSERDAPVVAPPSGGPGSGSGGNSPDHVDKAPAEFPDNIPPDTLFEIVPPDTVSVDQVFFQWIGIDVDGEVVAFQTQLVETDSLYFATGGQQGHVIRSLHPFRERDPGDPDPDFYLWAKPSADSWYAAELDDGWYGFRVRSIDDDRAVDPTPARTRFRAVLDAVAPKPSIVNSDECGRLLPGQTFHSFQIDASDSTRNGLTPRTHLEYSVQLRATSQTACTQHLADPFTAWRFFPDETTPIVIGNAPPTLYVDLFPPGCSWTFTLRVRDPAGNVGVATCGITAP